MAVAIDTACSRRVRSAEVPANVTELVAELALWMIQRGDFAEANTLLVGLRELEPASVVPDLLAGQLDFAGQRFPSAEQWFRRALAKGPDDPLARVFLAESLLPQRRLSEAAEALDRVVAASPESPAGVLAQRLLEALRLGLFRAV